MLMTLRTRIEGMPGVLEYQLSAFMKLECKRYWPRSAQLRHWTHHMLSVLNHSSYSHIAKRAGCLECRGNARERSDLHSNGRTTKLVPTSRTKGYVSYTYKQI